MTLYRYESGANDPVLIEYEVVKTTPKGFWIACGHKRRWMSVFARRPYAMATKQDAMRSFITRKMRHVELAQMRFEKAQKEYMQMRRFAMDTHADDVRNADEFLKSHMIFDPTKGHSDD